MSDMSWKAGSKICFACNLPHFMGTFKFLNITMHDYGYITCSKTLLVCSLFLQNTVRHSDFFDSNSACNYMNDYFNFSIAI